MVFRRENRVDSFQRQMSALRQQLGSQPEDELEDIEQMPELEDEAFEDAEYGYQATTTAQDNESYSFGSYPQQGAAPQEDDLTSPQIPELPSVDNRISVVAAGATWNGEIESETSIHVHGKVEGSLKATDDIWIAQGAEVNATVTARRVVVGGTVSGTVRAQERFEALPQGQVDAEVFAPTFVVHEGANVNGQLHMRTADTAAASESRQDRTGTASVIQRRSGRGS